MLVTVAQLAQAFPWVMMVPLVLIGECASYAEHWFVWMAARLAP